LYPKPVDRGFFGGAGSARGETGLYLLAECCCLSITEASNIGKQMKERRSLP
jgi:hypothetical protein